MAAATAGTFGPYVTAGIRTEQLVVYGSLALLLLSTAWWRVTLGAPTMLILYLLGAQLVVAASIALAPPVVAVPPGDPIAGLDNLLMPIAAVVITAFAAWRGEPRRLLRVACSILVVAACLNTAVAIWSVQADASELLSAWWASGEGPSTAELAATMGRFSGLFNQPAEAGLMYSVAVGAAIHLLRARPVLLAVSALVITVGGGLSASKVYLFIGLPFAAWQAVTMGHDRVRRTVTIGFAVVLFTVAVNTGLIPTMPSQEVIGQYFGSGDGQSWTDLYTAGRFGSDSTLAPTIALVMQNAPLAGFGLGGLLVAYDNGWMQSLVISGLFGVAVYTSVLVVLAAGGALRTIVPDRDLRILMRGIAATAVGGSMGIAALSSNRASTVMWIIATLVLAAGREDPARRSDAPAPAPAERKHDSRPPVAPATR